MAIDFVKPGDAPKRKAAPTNYDVDYTNPRDNGQTSNTLRQPPQPLPKPLTVQSIPVTPIVTEHRLPPPPPPPVHPAKVVPTPVAAVQPVVPQPQIQPKIEPKLQPQPQPQQQPQVAKPNLPPPPPVPVKTIQPAPVAGGPAVHRSQLTAVGEIVSQNVSSMRGETTNPAVRSAIGLSIDLLPFFSNRSASQPKALRQFLRLIALTMMLITLLYIGMVGYATWFRWQTDTLFNELAEVDSNIMQYTALQTEINDTATTLEGVNTVFSNQVYWSNWLTILERHTLPSVSYTNFSGSHTGIISLDAQAPDYATITAQIAEWRTVPGITSINVNTANLSDAQVRFTLSLEIDPALLHYQTSYAQPEWTH